MNLPPEMWKRLLHAAPTFDEGTLVTVNRPVDGYHLVDRGMLSASVRIPLYPGDRVEYRGPHLKKETVVLIPTERADEILARVSKESERAWIEKDAFFVYLPNDVITQFNDR